MDGTGTELPSILNPNSIPVLKKGVLLLGAAAILLENTDKR